VAAVLPMLVLAMSSADRAASLADGVEQWERARGRTGRLRGANQLVELLQGRPVDARTVVVRPGKPWRRRARGSDVVSYPLVSAVCHPLSVLRIALPAWMGSSSGPAPG